MFQRWSWFVYVIAGLMGVGLFLRREGQLSFCLIIHVLDMFRRFLDFVLGI